MAHLTADAMTAGPAKAVHAGLNTVICKSALGATASGSLSIALCPLPAGAEVTDVAVYHSNSDLDTTGGGNVSVFANIGGITSAGSAQYQYIMSASAAVASSLINGTGQADVGTRITASANLFAHYTSLAGTGTATVGITVIVQYLAEKRGD